MGTFPSMYYGADFEPHAIIMSKPLANVGTIGNRARLLAPEVFPTGIDVLHLQGTSGRHNDDSYTATTWFVNFYRMILENDFGRKE